MLENKMLSSEKKEVVKNYYLNEYSEAIRDILTFD